MNMQRRHILFGISSLTLLAGLSACATGGGPSAPQAWQQVIGRGGVALSGVRFDRLKRVGLTVLPPAPDGKPWQFGVSNARPPEAYATLDNGIIVSTSMIDLCENDGQLAAVIALRGLAHVALLAAGATGGRPDYVDIGAIISLAKAGYDPRDASVIIRRLALLENDPNQSARISLMNQQLRLMGYQVYA